MNYAGPAVGIGAVYYHLCDDLINAMIIQTINLVNYLFIDPLIDYNLKLID
jgi:hypothetical protein